ncbi:MAG: tetratricopeptide repeat protein [Saprospiraceae bacterium]|nr:tetratricopeptide repeat protein [Saprospiraceae bacterium]
MQANQITFPLGLLLLCYFFVCCHSDSTTQEDKEPAATSLNGEPLYASAPSEKILIQLQEKEHQYRIREDDPDNIIWYGRFLAYAGRYKEAIAIFSEGIKRFPEDARFYRHRGHRYITIREFEKSIEDLKKAALLIDGKENQIEPDGLPNAQNIPVSTLHGNIWYHLGLAYYLQHDFTAALTAFINCLRSGSNDDNIVSASHWIYTIMCRINRSNDHDSVLDRIDTTMNIIENFSYHKLCLLYKGAITLDQARRDLPEGPAMDAFEYGVARWYACQGNQDKCDQLLYEIVSGEGWASFGYIAAEADLYQ